MSVAALFCAFWVLVLAPSLSRVEDVCAYELGGLRDYATCVNYFDREVEHQGLTRAEWRRLLCGGVEVGDSIELNSPVALLEGPKP